MRFSWTGLILAPLLVPVMFSMIGAAMLSSPQEGGNPVLGFLVLLILGCVVSRGATIFLFLPCLFLLSLWWPVTAFRACLLGLLLGAHMIVPLTWLEWKSSGPDSGPPTESFLVFFVRSSADPLTAMFSARRTDNGRAVLAAGNAAARPVGTLTGIAISMSQVTHRRPSVSVGGPRPMKPEEIGRKRAFWPLSDAREIGVTFNHELPTGRADVR
jgi:hypothetical protein